MASEVYRDSGAEGRDVRATGGAMALMCEPRAALLFNQERST